MIPFWIKIVGHDKHHDIGVIFDLAPEGDKDFATQKAIELLKCWRKDVVINGSLELPEDADVWGEFNIGGDDGTVLDKN